MLLTLESRTLTFANTRSITIVNTIALTLVNSRTLTLVNIRTLTLVSIRTLTLVNIDNKTFEKNIAKYYAFLFIHMYCLKSNIIIYYAPNETKILF